ncbi:MAG: flagellin [Desulfitobacterium sp.]
MGTPVLTNYTSTIPYQYKTFERLSSGLKLNGAVDGSTAGKISIEKLKEAQQKASNSQSGLGINATNNYGDSVTISKEATAMATQITASQSLATEGNKVVGINTIDSSVARVRSEAGETYKRMHQQFSKMTLNTENAVAAESRIRDANIAKEIEELIYGKTINQASTGMLAQANQSPQRVLQLLG